MAFTCCVVRYRVAVSSGFFVGSVLSEHLIFIQHIYTIWCGQCFSIFTDVLVCSTWQYNKINHWRHKSVIYGSHCNTANRGVSILCHVVHFQQTIWLVMEVVCVNLITANYKS